MKASDLFVRQLEEEGVRFIFGLPGEENLDLLESLRKSAIRLIICRHEQAAAFMAATYGRLTGRAGVCFSTLGPGATNLVTGIAHAQLIGAPLVSLSGQKALRHNRQGKFQLVDVSALMKPITKKTFSLADPDTIPTVLREAFKTAEAERPGAVHVELPEDVAAEETKSAVQKRSEIRRPVADERVLARAAELIGQAKNPLIIVSAGANRRRIAEALLDFVRKTGIYAVHTQMGKGIIPDDCPFSLHTLGIHTRDYVYCGIDRADLLITVGYHIVEYPPSLWNSEADKTILNIDFVPAETDRYFNPHMELVGDIAHSLKMLGKMTVGERDFPIFRKTRELVEEKIKRNVPDSYPLHPGRVVLAVRETMAERDIVVLDNGIYKLWFSRLYPAFHYNTFLLDNALATMGAGLPAGIAAGLCCPDRKILAVCGDGGFLMNSQELETAVRYGIPLVVLILNDDAFGFIKWKQQKRKFPPHALDYGNPDFVHYAESFGAAGFRVQQGDDLAHVLQKAFSSGRVAVVECPIDYSVNYEVFSTELENVVCGF